MPAYAIVEVEVTDPEAFEAYKAKVPGTIEAHGGRYLVRGATTECMEGDWNPARVVVLEFPDMATLKAWHGSEMYAEPKAMRLRAATSRMIAVEGVEA